VELEKGVLHLISENETKIREYRHSMYAFCVFWRVSVVIFIFQVINKSALVELYVHTSSFDNLNCIRIKIYFILYIQILITISCGFLYCKIMMELVLLGCFVVV
jgi:hypothetical protein